MKERKPKRNNELQCCRWCGTDKSQSDNYCRRCGKHHSTGKRIDFADVAKTSTKS